MVFEDCKLPGEQITLDSKVNSNIHRLVFYDTGKRENSNWEDYPERFENLMRAVSKSSIKESLKVIEIEDCGVTIDKGELIMESLGMDDVEVTLQDYSGLFE